jgi:hypothetical protein
MEARRIRACCMLAPYRLHQKWSGGIRFALAPRRTATLSPWQCVQIHSPLCFGGPEGMEPGEEPGSLSFPATHEQSPERFEHLNGLTAQRECASRSFRSEGGWVAGVCSMFCNLRCVCARMYPSGLNITHNRMCCCVACAGNGNVWIPSIETTHCAVRVYVRDREKCSRRRGGFSV